MDIANKVFIVTGGASGLGAGTARMLTANGAHVVVEVVAVHKEQLQCRQVEVLRQQQLLVQQAVALL